MNEQSKNQSQKSWYAAKAGNDYQGLVADEGTGETIAVVYNRDNSDLLAAAPDLLEWGKDALSCLREYVAYAEEMRHIGRGFFPTGENGHRVGSVIHGLDAAIAKARGDK